MRFNDKELITISNESGPALEGILHHMKPTGNDWSDWYQQSTFKERYFKLISNMLFYYRINEPEAQGVLILENAHVNYEKPVHRSLSFAFSISFKISNTIRDNDSKHIFSCRCEADVNKWVSALKMTSYEYLRSQCIILKAKISMKTGKDPVLDYMKNNLLLINKDSSSEKLKKKKPTFQSHIDQENDIQMNNLSRSQFFSEANNVQVENLIEL